MFGTDFNTTLNTLFQLFSSPVTVMNIGTICLNNQQVCILSIEKHYEFHMIL